MRRAFSKLLADLSPLLSYWVRVLQTVFSVSATEAAEHVRLIFSGKLSVAVKNILSSLSALFMLALLSALTSMAVIINAMVSLVNNVFQFSATRSLTDMERKFLFPVFGNTLDYDSISISTGGIKQWLGISPQTVGNTVFLRPFWWGERCVYPDGSLSSSGERLLAHEVAHAWQFQHQGFHYVGCSLLTQVLSSVGKRFGKQFSEGYSLIGALEKRLSFNDLNIEQQAVCAENLAVAFAQSNKGLDKDCLQNACGRVLDQSAFDHWERWLGGFADVAAMRDIYRSVL